MKGNIRELNTWLNKVLNFKGDIWTYSIVGPNHPSETLSNLGMWEPWTISQQFQLGIILKKWVKEHITKFLILCYVILVTKKELSFDVKTQLIFFSSFKWQARHNFIFLFILTLYPNLVHKLNSSQHFYISKLKIWSHTFNPN